jgi:hypothetical protein
VSAACNLAASSKERPSVRRPFQNRFIAQINIIMIGINTALMDGISVMILSPNK